MREKMSHQKKRKRLRKNKEVSFYAGGNAVGGIFYSNQTMFIFLYKIAYLNTTNLDKFLPSVISLLWEYNVFYDDVIGGLLPLKV